MKRFIIILSIAGLISPGIINAQKFYVEGGRFILDCSAGTGFPDGAATTVPKYVGPEYGSPSTSTILHPENRYSGEINKLIYHKLEIAPYNLDSDGSFNTDNTPEDATINWVDAYNGCRNSDYDGGGWRLPTYREMLLIGIFLAPLQIELEAHSYPPFIVTDDTYQYWTATESDTSLTGAYAWYIYNQIISTSDKRNRRFARCVREVP